MPTIVLESAKKIIKYVIYFFIALIGLYIGTLVIQCVFNLGTYLGSYIRCLYSALC